MKPKAPRRDGEPMPPKGDDSMQPVDSRHPAAAPNGEAETDDD